MGTAISSGFAVKSVTFRKHSKAEGKSAWPKRWQDQLHPKQVFPGNLPMGFVTVSYSMEEIEAGDVHHPHMLRRIVSEC